MRSTGLPELRIHTWRVTRDALHAYAQVAGAIRASLAPREKHWYQVSLRVAASGFTTTPLLAPLGTFEITLDPSEAPLSVARVVRLARRGHYNGLTWHRIAPNFVIQGGSPGANEYAGDGPFMRDELGLRSGALDRSVLDDGDRHHDVRIAWLLVIQRARCPQPDADTTDDRDHRADDHDRAAARLAP